MKKKQICREDVQNILSIVFERGQEYFREIWTQNLDESGRELLHYILTPSCGPLNADQRVVARRLVRKERLQPAPHNPTGYNFQVPLIRLYIERLIREKL